MQSRLFALGQRVLDGQGGAGDRFQVVEDQQVASWRAQLLGQQRLLRVQAQGLEPRLELDLAAEPARQRVQDLAAASTRVPVIAKIEDLVHKAGELPPPDPR